METENEILSIIIPIFNEEENIPILLDEIDSVSREKNLNIMEIIFVNDGSMDRSEKVLKKICKKNDKVTLINFSKNFGQTAALSAGFDKAKGNIIITMDGDLQNDPKDIPKLLERIDLGYDVVSGWRRRRKDKPITRVIPSRIANRLISTISGIKLHDYGCTLKAYRKDYVKEIRLYGEMHRFIPIYVFWVGGKVSETEVHHRPRKFGQTKYGLNRTMKVISDLIFLRFIDKYSMQPIHLFGRFGLLNFLLSFGTFFLMIYFKYWGGKSFIETPLPQLVILFFLVGILSLFMGFNAEVLMRTYYESQGKKTYRIRDIVN